MGGPMGAHTALRLLTALTPSGILAILRGSRAQSGEQQLRIPRESGDTRMCHSRTESIRVVRVAPLPRRIARGAQVLRLLRLLSVLRVHVASPLEPP